MSLIELKRFLESNQEVSLLDLCRLTKRQPEVLRDMLAVWMRKGKVCLKQRTDACGSSCTQCDPLFTETYLWL